MKRLLVTPGAGFIGSNFARTVLNDGRWRVPVRDNLTDAGHQENLTHVVSNPHFLFVEADIANFESVTAAIGQFAPVVVVNFAAETHADHSIDGPSPFIQSNIVGVFNLFNGLRRQLQQAASHSEGATVFGYRVKDPWRYGVVEFGSDGSVLGTEEKPSTPKSSYAVTGLYFCDNKVLDIAASLSPSERVELEITDINAHYLARGDLRVELLGPGMAWIDTGTHEAILQASNFIQTVQKCRG
ncbi:MAG: nucleoside-diphosphate-sugar epimerase [Gammaproteobacteria bacterium]|jgi:nucleoside-diphosphate-sugar epimerase